MLRGRTVVKWQVLLEDADWDSDNYPSVPSISPEESPATPISPRRRRLLWSAVGIIVVAAMTGGYLLWRTAQDGLQLIETELEQTIVLEEWTAAAHSTADGTGEQLTTVEPSAPVTVALESFDLIDEVACAEVMIEDSYQVSPYRQTRFYQQTEMGWQRTAAPPSFWGEPQQLESEHFIFLASRRDLPIAAEAAPLLDAFYTRTCLDLGLPPDDGEKIIVEFLTNPSEKTHLFVVNNHLKVPSLALRQVPVDFSETAILVQLMKVSLVHHLLIQVEATWIKDLDWPLNWSWGTMSTGLISWLVWDQGSLLGQRFEDLVGWFYQEGKGVHLYEAESLPANYQEFCQICNMLEVTPQDLGVPFVCTGNVEAYNIFYYSFPPLTTNLWDLEFPYDLVVVPTSMRDAQELAEYHAQGHGGISYSFLGHNLASFTLIDYAVNAYGRERLPEMLAVFGSQPQLYTAIPTVYGVSTREFEESWRAYLQEKYDLAD
ncbi:MAG: hypothetical protein KF893_24095 [Caldilineaceae bacterium]|nr:hypothetical protein [Caldilineaceae bacterium]